MVNLTWCLSRTNRQQKENSYQNHKNHGWDTVGKRCQQFRGWFPFFIICRHDDVVFIVVLTFCFLFEMRPAHHLKTQTYFSSRRVIFIRYIYIYQIFPNNYNLLYAIKSKIGDLFSYEIPFFINWIKQIFNSDFKI